MTKIAINIIPSDYNGNPQDAMGYSWQDRDARVAGRDMVMTDGLDSVLDQLKAEFSECRIICPPSISSLVRYDVVASINCMWCGGQDHYIVKASSDAVEPVESVATVDPANDDHGIGYCHSCESYCYGDCMAN